MIVISNMYRSLPNLIWSISSLHIPILVLSFCFTFPSNASELTSIWPIVQLPNRYRYKGPILDLVLNSMDNHSVARVATYVNSKLRYLENSSCYCTTVWLSMQHPWRTSFMSQQTYIDLYEIIMAWVQKRKELIFISFCFSFNSLPYPSNRNSPNRDT